MSCVAQGTWAFMSGPLLKYPLKPPTVSDDLESFVHVVNFCTLRWHWTNYTKEDSWNQRPKSSKLNRRLAKFINHLFYDDSGKIGDYWYGGDGKFEVYEKPTPSFTLHRGHKDALAFTTLLEELHRLCHLHYKSLDLDELQKYTRIGQDTHAPSSTLILMEALEQKQSSFQTNHDVFSDSESESDSEPNLAPKPEPEPTTSRLPPNLEVAPRPVDPLQNHSAIRAAFKVACSGKAPWDNSKKTPDQFLNLPGIQLSHNKNESSVGVRKPESQDVDGEASRDTKRSKTGSYSHGSKSRSSSVQ